MHGGVLALLLLLLVPHVNAQNFTCPMLVGDAGDPTVTLVQDLSTLSKHMVVAVRPHQAPCAAFLTNRTYYVRTNTTDAAVLRMVIDDDEFAHLDKLFGGAMPKRVLDLGANIGVTTAHFAQRWPGAQIAAVEPSSDNFRMAVLNNLENTNVRLFWGGIWDRQAKLTIRPQDDPSKGWGEWGFVVEELSDARMGQLQAADIIPAHTIDGIMASMGWDFIDYVKVDVECAEFQLFANTSRVERPWLSRIGCLSMELHLFCDAPQEVVKSGLTDAGFDFKGHFGELDFWCRNATVPQPPTTKTSSTPCQQVAPAESNGRGTTCMLVVLPLMFVLFVAFFHTAITRLLGGGPMLRSHVRLARHRAQHGDGVI